MGNKYTKQKIDIQRVISLYESGMTQLEVAQKIGTSQKVIWHRFNEIGYQCRKAAKRNQIGGSNHMWKGDEATVQAFHCRLKTLFGTPQKCDVCGTADSNKAYDWANLTGKYEDVNDYKRMCRSCHWKYDKKYLNFKGAVGGRKAVVNNAGAQV